MIVVIIAGGSGTRLWPLSTHKTPKHLLALSGEKTLLQNTFARAKTLTDKIYVVTEASHSDQVLQQLPGLPKDNIFIEPARRGTASCIALALAYLGVRSKDNEPIAFLHADHHITNTELFANTIRAACLAAVQEESVALVGLQPTYPATGFGYIELGSVCPAAEGFPVYRVNMFKEKPNLKTAKSYIASGNYLWNLGLFAATRSVFECEIQTTNPPLFTDYQRLCRAVAKGEGVDRCYLEFVSQPVEIAVIERSKNTVVIAGTFDWFDIGSFFDLHKLLHDAGKELVGNVTTMDCVDTMIHAGERPVIAIGLEGLIIVDTPDGLLVCAKEQSQKVGDIVKQLGLHKSPK